MKNKIANIYTDASWDIDENIATYSYICTNKENSFSETGIIEKWNGDPLQAELDSILFSIEKSILLGYNVLVITSDYLGLINILKNRDFPYDKKDYFLSTLLKILTIQIENKIAIDYQWKKRRSIKPLKKGRFFC